MGCCHSRSETEMKIREIWDLSEICQMNLQSYIKLVMEAINEAKTQAKEMKMKKEEIPRTIFQEIVISTLKSSSNDDLFERIRFHIVKDDKSQNQGYCCIFTLILLTKGNYRDKVQAFNDFFLALNEVYNLKGHIKTNFLLFKSILILYVDLVSFLTVGYLININRDNDHVFLERLNLISKCFRIGNRTKLCDELLEKWSSAEQSFILDDFLREKESDLDHTCIRDKLIELDYGKDGLKYLFNKTSDQDNNNSSQIENEELNISINEPPSLSKEIKKNKK